MSMLYVICCLPFRYTMHFYFSRLPILYCGCSFDLFITNNIGWVNCLFWLEFYTYIYFYFLKSFVITVLLNMLFAPWVMLAHSLVLKLFLDLQVLWGCCWIIWCLFKKAQGSHLYSGFICATAHFICSFGLSEPWSTFSPFAWSLDPFLLVLRLRMMMVMLRY